jgi:hypothetical protein
MRGFFWVNADMRSKFEFINATTTCPMSARVLLSAIRRRRRSRL